MSTSLGYSMINNENENNENINIKRRNKTLKNTKTTESMKSVDKVNNIREKMGLEGFSANEIEPMNNEEGDSLANFEPPSKPLSAGSERLQMRESYEDDDKKEEDEDKPLSKEGFSEMKGGYSQQYYDQFIPYSTSASNSSMPSANGNFNNSEIMTKLNYLINLIEEGHDEKKNSVTEELVLYCFLGVFVIFIVDSFTKAGKYVR